MLQTLQMLQLMCANMQVFCFQTAGKKAKYFNKKPTLYAPKWFYIINSILICLPETKMLVQPGVRSSDYITVCNHTRYRDTN